jgi:hypothetical protein
VSALFNPRDKAMNKNTAVSSAKNSYGCSKVDCDYVRELQSQGAPIIITYPAGVVGSHAPGLSDPHLGINIFIGRFTFNSTPAWNLLMCMMLPMHMSLLSSASTAPIDLCLVGTYYSWTPLLQIVNRLTGRKSF